MDTTFREYLVGRGLESGLAAALADAYPDWKSLIAEQDGILRVRFGPQAPELIARAKGRREIPVSTIRQLTDECDWCCCYCWNVDKKVGVVIHHIEEHASRPDDSYGNLIVLCPTHHSEVHTKHEITRHPYPPDALRQKKSEFAAAIAAFRAGTRPAPGREKSTVVGRPATAPLPPATFTGRADALAHVGTLLSRGPGRVALVGMGGVGKTTLALKAIHANASSFPGGTFWLEHDDGDGTIRRLLRGLILALDGDDPGLDEETQYAFAQALLVAAAERQRLLVVIDGASEHNLGGLVRLLSGLPPSVAVLVTTRDLAVAPALGTTVVEVSPMPRAESRDLLTIHGGAGPGTDEERQRLLGLLGDLPLALELVAKQVALRASKPGFSLSGICDQLERFNEALLSFPGHRGLAMSFALSYASMDDREMRLFRALGTFADGPMAAASAAAVAGIDAGAAETALDRLVSISVLQWHALPAHFQAHVLIRKYAEHLLGEAPEEEKAVRRNYFTHFIASADAIAGRNPLDLRAMDAVHANYTKAMSGAARDGEDRLVARSMSTTYLSGYFDRRNLDREALPLLELAAKCAEGLSEPDLHAELLSHRGRACLRLGMVAKGIPIYEEAIAITRRTGNGRDLASNLQNLGEALVMQGTDLPRAERLLQESIKVAEEAKNADAYAAACTSLGGLHRHVGQMDSAADYYERGLQFARIFGNRFSIGNNLSNLGLVHLELGQFAKAEGEIREALSIAREIGDRRGEGNRIGHLGRILIEKARALPVGPGRQDALEDAARHAEAAMAIAAETNDPSKEAVWQMNLGVILRLRHRHQKAHAAFQTAIGIATRGGLSHLHGQILLNVGVNMSDAGKPKEALEALRHARQLLTSVGSPLALQADHAIKDVVRRFGGK